MRIRIAILILSTVCALSPARVDGAKKVARDSDKCRERPDGVGFLTVDKLGSIGQCSVALIAERLVLTAAHCFDTAADDSAIEKIMIVSFDWHSGQFNQNSRVLKYKKLADRDVSIVLLESPIAVPSIELRSTVLKHGSVATASGYTERGDYITSHTVCGDWSSEEKGIPGDVPRGHSGGALLDSAGRLAGVISANLIVTEVINGISRGSEEYIAVVPLAPLRAQIGQTIEEWECEDQLIGPIWGKS